MKENRVMQLGAGLLLLLAALALPGRGASLTNTATWAASLTDWAVPEAVAKFDPSLGTLTQLEFKVQSSLDTVYAIKNDTTQVQAGWFRETVDLSLTDPNGLWAADTPQLSVQFAKFSYTNLAVSATTNSPGYVLNNQISKTYSYADQDVLTAFTGVGTLDLTGATETSYSGTGGATPSFTTHASAVAIVIYDYVVTIPEPGSVSLLALACCAFLYRRRKFKSLTATARKPY